MADEQLSFNWPGDAPPRLRSASPPMPLPEIAPLAKRLRRLADRGVYLGTSSWKYPGWLGQIYDPARYQTRKRLSQRKFDEECLAEYAGVFPTVGGDFSFYQLPKPEIWPRIFSQTPPEFRFSLKAPEDVTVERWPDLPRYGRRAGRDNPHFLDAEWVKDGLVRPLSAYRDRLGVLIFEFGKIHRPPFNQPARFTEALDKFLARLAAEGLRFAVEVRNRTFLEPPDNYLACLRRHSVAHCLNSWTRMPPLPEQAALPGIFTAPHVAARLLLRPGRSYQQAVEAFSPYSEVRDPYEEGRAALRGLIERCLAEGRMLFAYVNNRFEGNAPQTIEAAMRDWDERSAPGSTETPSSQ